MKFALINKERRQAEPGLTGECPFDGQSMIAKCGNRRARHWAHKRGLSCDPWWENETEWHRAWKDQFPLDWQEYVHHAANGERHIADVKTRDGWILEFQHSHIAPEERRSREAFYQSLIWVVDGTRRKRDVAQFTRAWASGESPNPLSNKRRIPSPKGALLEEWAGSPAHVFFDFGDNQALWWVFLASDNTRAYIQHVSRAQFVRIHQSTGQHEFDSLVGNFIAFVAQYESPPQTIRPRQLVETPQQPQRLPMIRRTFRL